MQENERNVGFTFVRLTFVGVPADSFQYPAKALQHGIGRIAWRRRKFQGVEAPSVQEKDVRERSSGIHGHHGGDLSLFRFAHKFLGPFGTISL